MGPLGVGVLVPLAAAQADQVHDEEEEVEAEAHGGHQAQEKQRLGGERGQSAAVPVTRWCARDAAAFSAPRDCHVGKRKCPCPCPHPIPVPIPTQGPQAAVAEPGVQPPLAAMLEHRDPGAVPLPVRGHGGPCPGMPRRVRGRGAGAPEDQRERRGREGSGGAGGAGAGRPGR